MSPSLCLAAVTPGTECRLVTPVKGIQEMAIANWVPILMTSKDVSRWGCGHSRSLLSSSVVAIPGRRELVCEPEDPPGSLSCREGGECFLTPQPTHAPFPGWGTIRLV